MAAQLSLSDFSGGLNMRAAPDELAPNESPDLWNVTIDERGGVVKRLGYTKENSSTFDAGASGPPKNVFWSEVLQEKITQCGTKLFKGNTTSSFKTFTTSARVGFADYLGKVFIAHPVDGLFNYDGTTITNVFASPTGDTLAVWQNKLWMNDKTPTTGTPSRVYFTAAGVGTSMPNSVDVREKDDAQVICLYAESGLDIAGRPGLIVSKNRSTYRIYDSTSGAYQTIDGQVGAASNIAVTAALGQIFVLSERGVFMVAGGGQLKRVSAALDPLFDPAKTNYAQLGLFCAGARRDRCYFSLPFAGDTANDIMLEYHASEKWFTANSNAASCYTTRSTDGTLISGSPSVAGQDFAQIQAIGSDNGANIASRFQTAWYRPNAGLRVQMRRARIRSRGSLTFFTRKDYGVANLTQRSITGFTSPAYTNVFSLGSAKSVAFRIEETSSIVSTITDPITVLSGSSGAWALYGIDLYAIPLGLS